MGACLSSTTDSLKDQRKKNSALVISIKGDLKQYPIPFTVSEVLQTETSSSSSSSFFVCNSDSLSYDEFIVALDLEDELDAGQIYFILPTAKLQYRLSASDMAALAVKASVALNSSTIADANTKSKTTSISVSSSSSEINYAHKRKNKARILPFVVTESNQIDLIVDETRLVSDYRSKQQQTASLGVSRSGSIKKSQRLSSRKAQLAVRSFRLRLSTILESSDP